MACFQGLTASKQVFLSAHGYAIFASDSFANLYSQTPDLKPIVYDIVATASSGVTGFITASGDTITLQDSSGVEMDWITWDTTLSKGTLLYRLSNPENPDLLLDTDTPADFTHSTEIIIPTSGVYIFEPIVDLCDMDGIQEVLPEGYGYDEAGNCEPLSQDQCSNIDAVQLILPESFQRTDEGECYEDICDNIAGLQRDMPTGYALSQAGLCQKVEDRQLRINEVLANVDGIDEGHEFIELFNPFPEPIDLTGYRFLIGKSLEHELILGETGPNVIPANGYVTYSDVDLGVSLLNTINSIRLVTPAGTISDELYYANPPEDSSWALIDGAWQYTDRPTAGETNIASSFGEEEVLGTQSGLAPCPSGKYRHPLTNRCRTIDTDGSLLASCDTDEYRSPDTNRCRKITSLTSVVLAPCAVGSVRNPSTNRCRKQSAATASLQPCQEGYERNPETNRCRKILSTVAAPSPLTQTASAAGVTATLPLHTAVVSTAALGVVGYGLYEWRSELGRVFRRLGTLRIKK
jgi:hypothetical protein